MLSTEENEYLTKIGPGTPTGSFMREYWLPAMISSELPAPDCDPVRVMMLGEQLIGFRDSQGRPGLIANLCTHRGASLFFGRNEESGIRCVYHGWKFDVDGNCVDMPNEPAESNFKSRIKAQAYPVKEYGGLIWVYMGSREVPPPLPGIEAAAYPEGEYRVQATLRDCNWLQALEGDIDTVHAAFLHGGQYKPEHFPEGTFNYYESSQRFARFIAFDTEYGCLYGRRRRPDRARSDLLASRSVHVPVLDPTRARPPRLQDLEHVLGALGRRSHAQLHDLSPLEGLLQPEEPGTSSQPGQLLAEHH